MRRHHLGINVQPPKQNTSADVHRSSYGDAIDAEVLDSNEAEPAALGLSATHPRPAPWTPDPHTPDPTTADPGTHTPSTVRYRDDIVTEKSKMVARIIVEARGISRREIKRDEFVKRYIPGHSPAGASMHAAAPRLFADGTVEGPVIQGFVVMLHAGLRDLNAAQTLPFPIRFHIESDEGLNRCYGLLTI